MPSYIAWTDAESLLGGLSTNNLVSSNDLNDPIWAKSDLAGIASGIIDPFGGTKAFRLQAAAPNAFIQQVLADGSSRVRVNAVWLRRAIGVGSIQVLRPDAGAFIPVSVTAAWQRFPVPGVAGVTRRANILISTSGDAVEVFNPYQEDNPEATADVVTTNQPATGLSNRLAVPMDRFAAWVPNDDAVGPEEEATGTGQLYRFTFREDHSVSFEIRGIPNTSMALMLRLQMHLLKGGLVAVHTGDSASNEYLTCCLKKGTGPTIVQSDARELEYTFGVTLLNVAGSPVRMIAQY